MPDESKPTAKRPGERLSEVLGLHPDNSRLWQPEELAAIFRHQLAAPVLVDLGGFDKTTADRLRLLTEAQGLLVKSFADLFRHPSPPVELLRLTKDYAKANRDHPQAVLPGDIATALYFTSIAAALVRCRKRISSLSDAQLHEGWEWTATQPWVDEATKDLVREALKTLPAGKNS